MTQRSGSRAGAQAEAILARGRQLARERLEGALPPEAEPMKRHPHPLPCPADCPPPPGAEAPDRVLEDLACQNQLLAELLGAVNGLTAAVLSIRENLAER